MMYTVCKTAALWFFKIFFRLKVRGLECIPRHGPFILAANHVSIFDPVLLGCLLPVKIFYLAKRELFQNPFMGWLLPRLNTIPLSRGTSDIRALKTAINVLKQDKPLLIFPQGTRGRSLSEALPGVGFLYKKTGAALIIANVTGTDKALPKGSCRPLLGQCLEVTYEAVTGINSGWNNSEIARKILGRIQDLGKDRCCRE